MLWGRFVRVFHWFFAVSILLNYWLLEGGEELHEWLGYALTGLVVARIVWGFIGGAANARFTTFVVRPRRIVKSLSSPAEDYREHKGHSPLGGWMMLFMLTLALCVGVSGWMQELDMFWGEDWVQWLHEYSSDGLIVAAAVHVVAIFWIQRRYKLPLVQSMLWKR